MNTSNTPQEQPEKQIGLFGTDYRPTADKIKPAAETQARLFEDGKPFIEDTGETLLF